MGEKARACSLTQFHLQFLHCDPAKNSEVFTGAVERLGQNGDLAQSFSPSVTSGLIHRDQWSPLVSQEYGNWQKKAYVPLYTPIESPWSPRSVSAHSHLSAMPLIEIPVCTSSFLPLTPHEEMLLTEPHKQVFSQATTLFCIIRKS